MASRSNLDPKIDQRVAEAGGSEYLLKRDGRYVRVVERPVADPISALFKALARWLSS
jgi:hypothetical protein